MIARPSWRHNAGVNHPGQPPLRVAEPVHWTDEALCNRFLPDVLRWCARLGGPYVDAEDAAHETMLVVMRKAHTVTDPAKLPAWVFGVTRRSLAWQRRKSTWRRFVGGALPEAVDPGPGPADDVESREAVQAVRKLLEDLSDEFREVIVLADLEGRTDEQVADLLGLPLGTAKSRLRRARARFAQLALSRGLSGEEAP